MLTDVANQREYLDRGEDKKSYVYLVSILRRVILPVEPRQCSLLQRRDVTLT